MLLEFKVWGHIGVSTSIEAVGDTIGPPADKLYPVEPVGVDTIIPSAVKEFRYSPLT